MVNLIIKNWKQVALLPKKRYEGIMLKRKEIKFLENSMESKEEKQVNCTEEKADSFFLFYLI